MKTADHPPRPRISVILVDGSFRSRFGLFDSLERQSYPSSLFEVLWVEHYASLKQELLDRARVLRNVRTVVLNRSGLYHSSYCFNAGLTMARGELLVVMDADVLVEDDFLSVVAEEHEKHGELAVYFNRLIQDRNDFHEDDLSFESVKKTCALKAVDNYGGCLSVRKTWLERIGGYELHRAFASGAHANGKDAYVRLKNLGLAVKWHPSRFLYHPWHPGTGYVWADEKRVRWQLEIIQYRALHLMTVPFEGMAGPCPPIFSVPPPPLGDPDTDT
jgi:hypothetical protein